MFRVVTKPTSTLAPTWDITYHTAVTTTAVAHCHNRTGFRHHDVSVVSIMFEWHWLKLQRLHKFVHLMHVTLHMSDRWGWFHNFLFYQTVVRWSIWWPCVCKPFPKYISEHFFRKHERVFEGQTPYKRGPTGITQISDWPLWVECTLFRISCLSIIPKLFELMCMVQKNVLVRQSDIQFNYCNVWWRQGPIILW